MNSKAFVRIAAAPYVVWMAIFVIIPLLFIVGYAFTNASGSFTLENFSNLGVYAPVFKNSFLQAGIATGVCLLIGYPFAYILSNERPAVQKVAILLIMLPMWCNLLIRTYALMALLDNGGLLNSFLESIGMQRLPIVGTDFGVILGMIYDFLPYMVLPIFTVMTKLDNRYIEAAHDLGCSNLQTLFRVVVPMTVSGVVSGVTMVFVPSISTFYISQKLGAGKIDLVGDTIERLFQNTSTYGVGATMSLIMMVLIIVSVCVMNRFTDNEEGGMVI